MSHPMFVLAPAALRMFSFSAPHLPHWVVHGSMMMRPLGFVPAACQRRSLQPLRFHVVKLTEFPAFSTTSGDVLCEPWQKPLNRNERSILATFLNRPGL